MEEKARTTVKRGGRYCVAGAANNVSCKNTSYTEGISMHQFPKDPQTSNKWVNFVRKHRVDFGTHSVTKNTSLCSAHFEDSCYSRPILDVGAVQMRRTLLPGAVPTRDTVLPAGPQIITARQKRQLKREFLAEGNVKYPKMSPPSTSTDLTTVEAIEEGVADDDAVDVVGEDVMSDEGDVAGTISEFVSPSTSQSSPTTQPLSSTPNCNRCSAQSLKCRALRKSNMRLRRSVVELKKKIRNTERDGCDDDEEEEDEEEEDEEEEDEEEDGEDTENNVARQYTSTTTESGTDNECDDEWASMEESTEENDTSEDDSEDNVFESSPKTNIRVDPSTPAYDEPKFVVFYSMLMQLFKLFCFKCKHNNPSVTMKQNGTMVTVSQQCNKCGENAFEWKSQPLVLGKYPAGNILLSFGILMSGASISKILLVFKHMGLSVYSARTFFIHQKKFLFPVILHYWEAYRLNLIGTIRTMKDVVWAGDGRFDSMGHSAKYGAYSMFCTTIMKIVHFEIVQANETGGSQQTELEGVKRSFAFLKDLQVSIAVFISDRHRGIAKWMRETQPDTNHYYDIWHVARSIIKKMLKASKEKGFEIIKEWLKGVRNHVYWCATSTKQGFEDLILAKWHSFMGHVSNTHTDLPNELFKKCAHEDDIDERKWIKLGTAPYDKLKKVLMKKSLVNDIKKLSPDAQTSCLEGFHATLNHWHPKMICFSWLGTNCRHILASLHFNENVHRQTQTTEEGKKYYTVTWPKYKVGEEVVREVACPPTYSYVDNMKSLLFTSNISTMKATLLKYSAKIPEPLNRQFTGRVGKDEAVEKYIERGGRDSIQLFPSVDEQHRLQEQNTQSQAANQNSSRRRPKCRTCGQPMRGHARGPCQGLIE